MKPATINPTLQFIQTVGVPGLVSGVQEGMLTPGKTLAAFRAVGSAIDTYVKAMPQENTVLTDLGRSISGLPARGKITSQARDKILGLLAAHREDVESAVRMALGIDVGQIAASGAAVVANLEPPFTLHPELCWIPQAEFKMKSGDMVTAGGFFFLDHIVSNAEFQVYLRAKGREEPREPWYITRYDQPALAVHSRDALAYSEWFGREVTTWTGRAVNGGLPTEVEWWRGAIGAGDDVFNVENPALLANRYGLKDMFGKALQITSTPLKDWSDRSILASVLSDPSASRWAAIPDFDSVCYPAGFRPLLKPGISV